MVGSILDVVVDDLDIDAPLAIVRALGAVVVDMTDALDDIGGMLVTSTLQRFEDETDPDGLDWPKSARAEAENGQTLTDRGHLRHSITHRADRYSVQVGTNVVYGAIHHFGGVIQQGNASITMPKRPYLGLPQDDARAAESIVVDHLDAVIGRAR